MSENSDAIPPKSKRGGFRPGAGRKPRGYVKPSALSELNVTKALASEPPAEIDVVAQTHARDALKALVDQLIHGKSEAAKVTAAKAILDRGYGKPAVDIGGDAASMLPLMMAPQAMQSATVAQQIRAEAQKYAELAVAVLQRIATNGASETAVVAAANALLDRGLGTVGKACMPEEQTPERLGKKELAQRAAEAAATGRYATPAPPRSHSQVQ
jgi:hypothetical protein